MDNYLSQIMGRRLLTAQKIFEDTGISRSTLSRIYRREVKGVRLSTLIKLCDYLQVPLSELIEYVPDKKKNSN